MPHDAGRGSTPRADAAVLLAEPTRYWLFESVVLRPGDIGRGDAAAAIRVSRPRAAFHLDRLVRTGLLEVSLRRPPEGSASGQAGPPGASAIHEQVVDRREPPQARCGHPAHKRREALEAHRRAKLTVLCRRLLLERITVDGTPSPTRPTWPGSAGRRRRSGSGNSRRKATPGSRTGWCCVRVVQPTPTDPPRPAGRG